MGQGSADMVVPELSGATRTVDAYRSGRSRALKHQHAQVLRGWAQSLSKKVDEEALRVWRRLPHATGSKTGLAVAAVHGLEGTWASWAALADALGEEWDVHALDLPWRANNRYRWLGQADPATWLRSIFQSLSVVPDVVVAHSFGASAVLELLSQWMISVRAVVLVAPLYRPHDFVEEAGYLDEATARFRAVMRQGLVTQLGGRVEHLPGGVLDAMVHTLLKRAGPGAVQATIGMLQRMRVVELGQVGIPVLILHSPDDPVAPPEQVRELVARLPAVRLHQSTDFSHFCLVDRPRALAGAIRDFLAGISGASPSPLPSYYTEELRITG